MPGCCHNPSSQHNNKEKFECILAHCEQSCIGTPDQPFGHLYVDTIHCPSLVLPHGPQGSAGQNGPQGFCGKAGCPGLRGFQGCRGMSGFQGKYGSQGRCGNEGKRGKRGYQGFQGRHGKPGKRGFQGFQGASNGGNGGTNGSQGPIGNPGPQGLGGSNGSGEGIIGPQGFKGDFGDNGTNGAQGQIGSQGNTGSAGQPGGPPGPQGIMGINGVQGSANGPLGPQGIVGPQGNSNGGGGGEGEIIFGTSAEENVINLNPQDVFINTQTGNMLTLSQTGKMTWQDIFTLGGLLSMTGACMSNDLGFLGVILHFDPSGVFLYRSLNQGVNFGQIETGRDWVAFACSANNGGAVVIGAVNSDTLFVSNDFGDNFTPRATVQNWTSVCLSGDGAVGMASVNGGTLYTSEDFGTTWISRDSSRAWLKICCSADGTKGFACTNTELYFSSDVGQTWNLIGPSFLFTSIGMNADASVIFFVTDGGTCYFSTNFGGIFELQRDSGVVDVAVSQDKLRQLFVNMFNTSDYSQDGGEHFNTTSVAFNFQQPLAMTSNGNFALVTSNTNNGTLYLGTAVPANVIQFNTLISDTKVTAAKLTDLTTLPGRIVTEDSILQAFSKLLRQESAPLGICINSGETDIGSVMTLAQDVLTPVSLATFSVSGPLPSGFIFDPDTGFMAYSGLDSKTFHITIRYCIMSQTSTGEVFCSANLSGSTTHCKTSLLPVWLVGCVEDRVNISFGTPIQLHVVNRNALNVDVQFSSIQYCVVPA